MKSTAHLISRSGDALNLQPLAREAIKALLKRAVYDTRQGNGKLSCGTIDEEALEFLADICGGDARNALNAIELGHSSTTEPGARTERSILRSTWRQQCIQRRSGAIRQDTETITTIRFLHLSKVCGGQIRMRQYIIWQGC
ncbi:MAG: hypothetical protein ACLU77_08310 [Waltera sp.]